MPKALVIGYGNTLRSDDGVGPYAAERLMELLPEDQAEVRAYHQLNPELAEMISEARLVVFIDAAAEGTPGTIASQDVVPGAQKWGAFVHQLGAADLLACARDLYGACPPAVMISVAGESFELGEQLSPVVASALDEVVRRVQSLL